VVPDISKIQFAFASLHPHHSSTLGELEVAHKYVGAEFDVFTYLGDPAAGHISSRPIEAEPGSEEALIKMVNWLRTCQTQHANCARARADGSKWAPTRLLDVWGYSDTSNIGMVRLIEPAKLAHQSTHLFPYAALSYTWGGDQPLRLEKNTAAALKQGFPVANLPQTIQDAVFVCVRLGLRYLWIDALCIAQDDNSDKASEIATMPKVYGYAVVTISATRSSSVNTGFLGRRTLGSETDGLNTVVAALGANPDALEEAYQIPFVSSHISQLFASTGPVGSIFLCAPAQEPEPLLTRGWAFQEQLLATRTIEFGSLRTVWHCLESHGVRGLADGWKDNDGEVEAETSWHDKHRKLWQFDYLANPLMEKDEARIKAAWMWKGLLESYSSRSLTIPTDRILAISGVAKKLSPILGTYKAGLWEPSFVAEMLWMVDYANDLDQRQMLCARPSKYQGPSWSWVSVNSPITYMELSTTTVDSEEEEKDIAYFPFDEINTEPCSRPFLNRRTTRYRAADIVKCQPEPTHPDAPFGGIREPSAFLEIKCATQPVMMTRRTPRYQTNQMRDVFSDAILNVAIAGNTEVIIFPDTLDDAIIDDSHVSVLLLEIATSLDYREKPLESITMCKGRVETLGIVVVSLEDGTGRFRRIGLFREHAVERCSHSWEADWETVDYSSEPSFAQRADVLLQSNSLFRENNISITKIV
jgi:hypothetical protein